MIFRVLIPITIRNNNISEASLQSSPKNVSMFLNRILYLGSLATNLRIILSKLIYLYFVYSVLLLYKS